MAPERSVAPKQRVNLVYRPTNSDVEVELPFRILVLGDFTRRADPRPLEERRPVNVDKDGFDHVLGAQQVALDLAVPDRLLDREGALLTVNLKFGSMKDFTPERLARQMPATRKLLELRSALNAIKGPLGSTPLFRKAIQPLLADEAGRQRLRRELGLDGASPPVGASLFDELLGGFHIKPGVEGYDNCKRGLEAVVAAMMTPCFTGERLGKNVADVLIADIDCRLSAQMNAVLHHPTFQALEAAWRGLKYLVDHVDFRENILVDLWNVSKDDLAVDFEDSPDVFKSGFYKTVYGATYGVSAGVPYGLVVADYEFGPAPADVWLLSRCAAVAAMAHTPILTAAAPSMFEIESWEKLYGGWKAPADAGYHFPPISMQHFEQAAFAGWRSFREGEGARWVGLCLPRFMLRLPYGANTVPVKAFNFEEDVVDHHGRYLWGNAAVALATRAADAFAKRRWCANIIGPQAGGAVEDLPLHEYEAMGEIRTRISTECQLYERGEYELSEEGFIGLTFRKDSNHACFFSASSCRRPRFFGKGAQEREAETDFRLGGQLPYLFVIARIAQYLKVIYRSSHAGWPAIEDGQRAFGEWLQGYVTDVDDPDQGLYQGIWTRRPFRRASVELTWAGERGMLFELRLQPHFKYMGARFTLSLAGRLDV